MRCGMITYETTFQQGTNGEDLKNYFRFIIIWLTEHSQVELIWQ